ncbi:hypothetical protein BXO88_08065 [Oribacterium sp. C9]|uniref:hypothetical protein n=1 Tax=Oribacterium sp. C9 TaxID=1943579 RepID=UPI00098F699F|nr:hypothetical protein [Oribacterium sp. C9]OON86459.1 hypothetical protein BXO88_08065 [Oribacterium sp. C9]
MSEKKVRSTKRKKKQEATLIGDLFKILFAVSMLVVAILVSFFVFKNVDGFSLPDLRVTIAETSEPVTVTVAPTESIQETTTISTTVSQSEEVKADNEEVEKNIESAEASVEAEESESSSDIEEAPESEEIIEESGNETQADKKKQNNDEIIEDRDYEESDYTDEAEKPRIIPENVENGIITEGPVAGAPTTGGGPGSSNDGIEISNGGPVVLN